MNTVLLPPDILAVSPSAFEGINGETELIHRVFGCEIIQEAGILLRLPQVISVTAQNIFHRFLYRLIRNALMSLNTLCVVINERFCPCFFFFIELESPCSNTMAFRLPWAQYFSQQR